MFQPPKMMVPAEYKKEFLSGLHQSEYNRCRFAENKIEYAEMWLDAHVPYADYRNPKNLIDKICNYKIYDRNILKQKWADKICSHWNLNEIGMPELAIEPVAFSRCYLTDTDWQNIPNGKYIIKMAHGSGWNIKFEKTDNFNPHYIQEKIWEWNNLNFAYVTGYEWQYENIQPGWIIQQDFGDLMNWEFWCEEGKIYAVHLIKKMTKNYIKSIAWVGKRPIGVPASRHFLSKSEMMVFEQMKPYVLKLAEPFKFVRVDLYHINNEIKFSELTFTPSSGRLVFA